MSRKKKLSAKKSAVSGMPKMAANVNGSTNFPTIGANISPYAPSYFKHQNIKPQPWWKNRRKVLKRAALVIGILLILCVGWVGYKFYKDFGGWSGIWGLIHPTRLKGEDVGRVTILLAGNSADDPGHNGANLTDSIMLISIDTRKNTAFMLSIPRDLYVNIPNNGYQKINAAYEDGQSEHFSAAGYPNGGMGLLEEVLSQKLGIPIDYYALIDYSAFKDSVNAVGGITVNIHSCDPRGLYDPDTDWATHGVLVNLSNGKHNLNGEQALDLARARGDAYGSYGFCQSDFTRQQDQRMMLSALENKALSVGVLANPLKLGSLFDSVGKNVKTDLTVSDMHRLYQLGKKVPNNQIKSASLGYGGTNPLLVSYYSYNSGSALIPAAGINNYSQIQAYVNTLTGQ